jgi:ABC-type dipeptide/oligopeptide/nickel transport system permease subunit
MSELTATPPQSEADPAAPAGSRRARPPVLVWISAAVAAAILVLVTVGVWIAPYDPMHQDLMNTAAGPGNGHLLGTDSLGRDVLALLMSGAHNAVIGPVVIALGAVLFGTTLGMMAGWNGGLLDTLLCRWADLMYALPGLLVVVVVVGVIDGGYWLAVFVLLVLSLPTAFRMTRSVAAAQVRLPYVEAARTLGLPAGRIIFRHILPNIMPTVLATFLLDFVGALIGLSGLSFLGLGAPAGTPDWGSLLQDGQSMLTVNPWVSLAPGLLLVLTATSITLLGDWMYDRYTGEGAHR